MLKKLLSFFLPKEDVYTYKEYSSESEFLRELHWFNFSRLEPYNISDRKKRVLIALAKRTGNPSMIDFKYKEVCA